MTQWTRAIPIAAFLMASQWMAGCEQKTPDPARPRAPQARPADGDGDGIPDRDDATPGDVIVDHDGDGRPDVDPLEPETFGPETPAPATRYARLTREQWENTVADLFHLAVHTGFSEELAQDASPAGFIFNNPAEALAVDATQWSGFQRAAGRVAELVTTNATLLAGVASVPIDANAFIRALGLRAHRRPLSEEDVALYQTVFAAGAAAYPGVDATTGGARLVIEAMLQSPFFLYRVELTTDVAGEIIRLDPYETAARLSYALWGSMPDDELLAAAAQGLLVGEGVEAQARRMLEDDKATSSMLAFHQQLLEAEKLSGVAPAPAFFPNAPAELGALARQENDLFLADLFTTGGGLGDMLTSTRTFVNDELAAIYGVEPPGGGAFAPVELDPTVRRGILTHVAFLAQNATSVDPDPIHRGVFIARRMACMPLSAPPANIPPLPPTQDLQTNRERVEQHTQTSEPCVQCHLDIINPFGFPYESYDATGALRTHDNGLPIDTASEVLLDEGPQPVADGVELAEAMADSRVVHECYAEHWLNVVSGRVRHDDDTNLIKRVGWASATGASVKDLLVEIVTSPAFLERNVVELEGGAE